MANYVLAISKFVRFCGSKFVTTGSQNTTEKILEKGQKVINNAVKSGGSSAVNEAVNVDNNKVSKLINIFQNINPNETSKYALV